MISTTVNVFLVAVSRSTPAVVVAARGGAALFDVREVGILAEDLFGHQATPSEPGLYVWEGTITAIWYATDDGPDITYHGTFRPAPPDLVRELLHHQPPAEDNDE